MMNPMQLMQMMKNGGNPQQMQNNLFEQKKINPINMLQNFFSMK